MGYNLVQNAVDHGIEVVAFDQNEAIAHEAENILKNNRSS